jgi:lipopolysaccharide transport system ATP-binding protein
MKLAINLLHVSKRYSIYQKPIHRLLQILRAPFLLRSSRHASYSNEIWALKDISFEISAGKTVGIIGKNGSGKSTLLQIICGITSPNTGEIKINGRIAALLELGSGFNYEFTGVENIYLNATILGLTKSQIDEKFTHICEFADIGDFIYQPLKTYSSGMAVRLAFAVIAHVDADILVIDEALAVGDAIFTQKCMRFLREFKKTKTVLFVSHDAGSVLNLCDEAIWLNGGVLIQWGPAKEVVEAYGQFILQEIYGDEATLEVISTEPKKYSAQVTTDFKKSGEGWATGDVQIASVKLLNHASSKEQSLFEGGERVRMEIVAKANRNTVSPIIGWLVKDRLGQALFGENTFPFMPPMFEVALGQEFKGSFEFDMPFLPNGTFSIAVSVAEGNLVHNIQHHWLHDAIFFEVISVKPRYGLVGISCNSVHLEVIQ